MNFKNILILLLVKMTGMISQFYSNENFLDDYIENIQLEFNKNNLNSHILVTCEFL